MTKRYYGWVWFDQRLDLTRGIQRAVGPGGRRGWVLALGHLSVWFVPLAPTDHPLAWLRYGQEGR